MEIKESCVNGFAWATKNGPICDEQIRGCKFALQDVTLHADAIHRGMGQIMPTARRVISRRCCWRSLFSRSLSSLSISPCHRTPWAVATVFSHWAVLQGDPTDLASKPGAVIGQVRKRKGLNPEIPPLDRFLDRL